MRAHVLFAGERLNQAWTNRVQPHSRLHTHTDTQACTLTNQQHIHALHTARTAGTQKCVHRRAPAFRRALAFRLKKARAPAPGLSLLSAQALDSELDIILDALPPPPGEWGCCSNPFDSTPTPSPPAQITSGTMTSLPRACPPRLRPPRRCLSFPTHARLSRAPGAAPAPREVVPPACSRAAVGIAAATGAAQMAQAAKTASQ